MHSIKDLEDRFGLSYWQARKRLGLIRENFEGEVKGGKNSKYWLTDNGLTILDRILELEGQKENLNTAVQQAKEELEDTDNNGDTSGAKRTKVEPKYVKRLENEVEFLREELRRKDHQIQQLLPAAKKERKSLLNRLFARLLG